MSSGIEIWDAAMAEAQNILAMRKVHQELQPTVNKIMEDPFATAVFMLRQVQTINKLQAEIAELKKAKK